MRRLTVCSTVKQGVRDLGAPANGNLVRYRCSANDHADAGRNPTLAGSPVTIYEGAWAYCPVGAGAEHVWEAIEPVSLSALKVIEIIVRPREIGPRTREARA